MQQGALPLPSSVAVVLHGTRDRTASLGLARYDNFLSCTRSSPYLTLPVTLALSARVVQELSADGDDGRVTIELA